MKIVLCRNAAFSFSAEAHKVLRELGHEGALTCPAIGEEWSEGEVRTADDGSFHIDSARNDARLIEVVERLGADANSDYADLYIVEIPDDVEWLIRNNDHHEWVAEKHRVWS